ncbi:MAG: FRG domain-containing protein [Leptospiraceae bacterium]|nr:FRG domain-containing protein [Leptospiraceae bacterium]
MPYSEITCDNADEFWNLLDPRNPLGLDFEREIRKKLIYRGQSDSVDCLVPSALRNYTLYKKNRYSNVTAREQINKEIKDLVGYIHHPNFVEFTNQGLQNLEISQIFNKKYFHNRYNENLSLWPEEEYLKYICKAQHNNINTCVLDWTNSAYIAAYFATYKCIWDDLEKEKFFTVWVYLPNEKSKVKVISDSFSDKNFINQKACFTLLKQKYKNENEFFIIETIDDISDENSLWKLNLKYDQSPLIMDYCNSIEINYSSVYKGRGEMVISEYIKEERQLEKLIKDTNNISSFDIFADPKGEFKWL